MDEWYDMLRFRYERRVKKPPKKPENWQEGDPLPEPEPEPDISDRTQIPMVPYIPLEQSPSEALLEQEGNKIIFILFILQTLHQN